MDFDSIEGINEDAEFSIGNAVKVKESGDTGKIISVDGPSGSYTVRLPGSKLYFECSPENIPLAYLSF